MERIKLHSINGVQRVAPKCNGRWMEEPWNLEIEFLIFGIGMEQVLGEAVWKLINLEIYRK